MRCCSHNSGKTVNFNVEGMSCQHCKGAIEKALNELGVNNVKVDLDGKKVAVNFNTDKVKEDDLKKAITDAGYEIKN